MVDAVANVPRLSRHHPKTRLEIFANVFRDFRRKPRADTPIFEKSNHRRRAAHRSDLRVFRSISVATNLFTLRLISFFIRKRDDFRKRLRTYIPVFG
jgi:hypothetical protein